MAAKIILHSNLSLFLSNKIKFLDYWDKMEQEKQPWYLYLLVCIPSPQEVLGLMVLKLGVGKPMSLLEFAPNLIYCGKN